MNRRPQNNSSRFTQMSSPPSPIRPVLREPRDDEEDARRKAVGSMLETVVSSMTLGVQSANRSLRKDVGWLIKVFGVMAFLIGVLLTMVMYAHCS